VSAPPPAVSAERSKSRPQAPLGQSASTVQGVDGASTHDVWQAPPLQSGFAVQSWPSRSPPAHVPWRFAMRMVV
jgi:hypothetical protein